MIIYQIFTRLFGNRNLTHKPWGTIAENGCGKMNDIDIRTLRHIRDLGVSHVWYTGVIRHASLTDYSQYGIPVQHPEVVKGRAGSPYAITDYYDIDPDLADDVNNRMKEFEPLVERTHHAGLKVIIDFVGNHVARQYKSVCKPFGVKDLGEDDDVSKCFSPQNNFYYCGEQPLDVSQIHQQPIATPSSKYSEIPAKATGNDRFDNRPSQNDWYETVKLNYGIDYCDLGGRSYHYDPIPDTWKKMTDILKFWTQKGVDGFRCDMAEMVPKEFWKYAITRVKQLNPNILFIAEVYDSSQYRAYIQSGFDFLYDKVGMYDTVRSVICGQKPASSITYEWQTTDDIQDHMLYFLENHDEQRIASTFFCGDGNKAIPGLIVSCLLRSNPFMLYAGQEVGESGMYSEGFSGCDGRTSIFDYWSLESLVRAYWDRRHLTKCQRQLEQTYSKVLNLAQKNNAATKGQMFDLMYVNGLSEHFNPRYQFAFLRKFEDECLLIVANFDKSATGVLVQIPAHAFDFLHLKEQEVKAIDLLTNEETTFSLKKDGLVPINLEAYSGKVYQFFVPKDTMGTILNPHNKDEFPPAHTAEHLLNQLMGRMFGAHRSTNAHIERKKSKMTFSLSRKPTRQEEKAIEEEMNNLIATDMPVTFEFVNRENLPKNISIDKLPRDAGDVVRLVHIGDYDVCPCIGKHVRKTSQIGRFVLLGTNWNEEKKLFRIRFKVIQ